MIIKNTAQLFQVIAPHTDRNAVAKIATKSGLPPQTIRNWRNQHCEASLANAVAAIEAAGYSLILKKCSSCEG